MPFLLKEGLIWKTCDTILRLSHEARTLSDMQSVILRSTHSLSPVHWASAKRSFVIAFMTRLVNWALSAPAPVWQKYFWFYTQESKWHIVTFNYPKTTYSLFDSFACYQIPAHSWASSSASLLFSCPSLQLAASPSSAASSTHSSVYLTKRSLTVQKKFVNNMLTKYKNNCVTV